ncbi:phage antirepressor KilAC domain-containing protein [Herminiimonas sp. CN]|uniref:phage antirepressor KilAC domain-containing protein n=1 Tax=Herminiimonas sp. CN TaxID=1349818 RepID=UPI0004743993|nr:phage antirepressor KilAC domain-containing protein [Herminiimonas sp. CN]
MNAIVNIVKTMSSVELVGVINELREEDKAELAHSDFMKKVAKVLGDGAGKFSDTYQNQQNGQTYPCYRLPKREASLMVMSESYAVQAKVYDRMAELEAKVPAIDPMQVLSDPVAMRGLLLTYTEKVLTLESKVAEQAPKVEALDRIATATDGSLCIRDAAKTLQVQEKKLKQILIQSKWAYQRPMGTGLLAYSERLQQGVMEHKIATGEKSDGSEWASTQARITAKGMARLSEMVCGDRM